ncbi:UNVERIFIED_CONTAM: hypothetical protein Sradi_3325100 [Sesamum radiatum]|uniref:ARM repeat superfamily protein n=1 Tax=Sesamum radiatum TaxID=300843 RepID=A0AAW2R1Z4_SESRA
MQKVPALSSSPFPLVRYFGWMAIARNANQFLKERLFLVSDLPQLTYLLSIFSDDLSLVDNINDRKDVEERIEELSLHRDNNIDDRGNSLGHQDGLQSFHALYPDISKFFPNLKKEFVAFGETILEAVGLQLKLLSSSIVPDLMCWLSDLCSWPFLQRENAQILFQHKPDYFKGFVAKNAKAVILYIIEAIVVEHMEPIVPEIPRVVQVLVSLCRSSYYDVPFLDSILSLLKPIIAYSLSKVSGEENPLADDSCDNFESLCFNELFNSIKYDDKNQGTPTEKGKCQALAIYLLATFFGDLSFHRKTELLQSTIFWAGFASFEGTNTFHDYICAYQVLMENCRDLLVATSRAWGVIPLKISLHSDTSICSIGDYTNSSSWFLNDLCKSSLIEGSEKHQDDDNAVADVRNKVCQLNLEEVKSLSKHLEALISILNPTLEKCWKLHHKLCKKLALTCAECFMYSQCLSLVAEKVSDSSGVEEVCDSSGVENLLPSKLLDEFPDFWRTSLGGLSQMILVLQEKHCWEVACVLLDSLLGVPQCFCLDNVIDDICAAVKNLSNSAPNISWRLQTDKMISLLLARGIHNLCQNVAPLVDLFCTILGHPEPEQRYIALKHLGGIVGQDSFLQAADSILHCLMTLAQPTCYGPLTQFSLALIATVCLYSPSEDISLIPESIWRNIETFGLSRTDRYCTGLEKKACEALCRLKTEGEQAKQILKEVLSSSPVKQEIPDFVSARESILQVIGNLTSARSYFDFFTKEADQKSLELEEAEMEMELLQKERPLSDSSFDFQDWRQLPFLSSNNIHTDTAFPTFRMAKC